MRAGWEDLNARARGLSTRLLRRARLEALAASPDLGALATELRSAGLLVPESPAPSPQTLDLAVRRMAAARLRTLARWSGPRTAVLSVVFEDEDRRSLRAILRGAVEGAPAEARLSGLIPTPSLPERALKELARQPTTAAAATLLLAWRHPYGPVIASEARTADPNLFRLEMALNRAFAARALAGARRSATLLAYVRDVIDLENGRTALVLASQGTDVVPKDVFLAGGRRVSIEAFELAVASGDPARAGERLSEAFAGTPPAEPFRRQSQDPVALERALLRAQIVNLWRTSRLYPLGPAPLLGFLLRLRAEVLDLRQIIWGVALGAPRAVVTETLVTA